MVTLFVQYFAFCHNEKFPNSKNYFQKQVQNFAKYLLNPKQWPKTFKVVSKWLNFANSGHTDADEAAAYRARFRLFDVGKHKSDVLIARAKRWW